METTPGKRILIWREYKGLTPAQMIRATGIKRSTLDSAEDPKGSNPSYDTLMKVVAAFPDLNARWLLTGEGDMLTEGRSLKLKLADTDEEPVMLAEVNQDTYFHRYHALLDMVKTGFFGSPEQLLGKRKKIEASADAAPLTDTVDALYAELFEPWKRVLGFQTAAMRQLAS